MLTLILMRHAKSSWDDPTVADHDRPLNRRGKEAARRMGAWLVEQGLAIDAVLCSTAVRAQETWRRMAKEFATPPPMRSVAELYLCEAPSFAPILATTESSVRSLLVIGHNPGLEDWLAVLVGKHEKFPTAAVAVIDVPIKDWSQLTDETRGQLRHLWRPRELPE